MNIKRILYKMNKTDDFKVGYLIGKYDGDNRTLLDENLNVVSKITYEGKEYTVYDMKVDLNKRFNIDIDL